MSTFIIVPEFGAQKSLKPRVTNISFGDGYEQRFSNGINTMVENWSLQFNNRSKDEADSFDSFLRARGGVESFDWTPPYETVSKKFKCQEWNSAIGKGNLWQMTATFIQVYEA